MLRETLLFQNWIILGFGRNCRKLWLCFHDFRQFLCQNTNGRHPSGHDEKGRSGERIHSDEFSETGSSDGAWQWCIWSDIAVESYLVMNCRCSFFFEQPTSFSESASNAPILVRSLWCWNTSQGYRLPELSWTHQKANDRSMSLR